MNNLTHQICYTALLLLGTAVPVYPASDESSSDAVRQALQQSILGEPEATRRAADQLRGTPAEEEALALSLTAADRLPRWERWEDTFNAAGVDSSSDLYKRLLEHRHPADRFLEAHRDRRYATTRHWFNGFVVPASYAVQGQFLALLTYPFQVVEDVFVRSRFLTPEQRAERYTARQALDGNVASPVAQKARDALRDKHERRRQLAGLQAEKNAQKALEEERPVTAEFWLERREKLLPQAEETDTAKDYRKMVTQRRARREQSSSVIGPGAAALSDSERQAMASLLSALILGQRQSYKEAADDFLVDYPESFVAPAVAAGEAALDRQSGAHALAGAQLEWVTREYPRDRWAARSEAFRKSPVYTPEKTMQKASRERADARWEFLLTGRRPRAEGRSLTAEKARQRHLSLFQRARRLYITDTLVRALFLPFQPPFPRDAVLDAAAKVPPDFWPSRTGQKWRRRVAKAYMVEQRYEEAAAIYTELNETDKAREAQRKAARALAKQAERLNAPARAADRLREALETLPEGADREELEEKLAQAERRAEARTVVTREELRRWPETAQTLEVPPRLYDKKGHNGEIGEEGLFVYTDGRLSYFDDDRGGWQELSIPAREIDDGLHHLLARRRAEAVAGRVKETRRRKRLPFALEAGAVPGFGASAGLVPLSSGRGEERLFQ